MDGSPGGTISKCNVPSQSQDQLGETLGADLATPAPKRVKADKKSKHIDKPASLTAIGVHAEYRRSPTPLDPVPRMLGCISLLTPMAELLRPMEGPSNSERHSSKWAPSPTNCCCFATHQYHNISLLCRYHHPQSVPLATTRAVGLRLILQTGTAFLPGMCTQPTPILLCAPTNATTTIVVQIPKRPSNKIGPEALLAGM